MQKQQQTKLITFPAAWTWLMDEAVTQLVKTHYSPRESWKNKPFGKEDARFFFKGIEELSEFFTEERPKGMPAYFQHPKFRSAYILYFLPLQAAKFISLFQMHASAFEAAWEHAKKSGVLRIADLGSGPGTASLAALLMFLERSTRTGEEIPKIVLEWIDTNRNSLEDGRVLVEQLSESFSRLRNRVEIRTHVAPWWKAPLLIEGKTSLLLLGHVLNESSGPSPLREDDRANWIDLWSGLFAMAEGGGTLIVDLAARRTSQLLSRFRDEWISSRIFENDRRIWGPCLHAKACPLADGRDWCHFSVPTEIPGMWFREFSKGLGSERQWLKFSYLWIASKDFPAPSPDSRARRVISDPLGKGKTADILICEPEKPGRIRTKPQGAAPIYRGEIIRVPKK
ncbi:MAG: hypothetical protein A2428_14105 [Bdellovibrionales bacterium RIFOXYC1_FULL_54_43]|nr:MAG: hypothetical protein A2428_14105 [Bdellovibrionales bacterium RIFOXYC1_FULL_54_43]OFZ78556.1 MAG: hypothetical protein A2603_01865 [Bdellovibrionales bacterium RIFOXYD1_FULL_55_31]